MINTLSYTKSWSQKADRAFERLFHDSILKEPAKTTAQTTTKVFFSALAFLETLFFSILSFVAIPLYWISPKCYTYLTDHAQAASRAIESNLRGKIAEKEPPSLDPSIWGKISPYQVVGIIGAIAVTLAVAKYLSSSPASSSVVLNTLRNVQKIDPHNNLLKNLPLPEGYPPPVESTFYFPLTHYFDNLLRFNWKDRDHLFCNCPINMTLDAPMGDVSATGWKLFNFLRSLHIPAFWVSSLYFYRCRRWSTLRDDDLLIQRRDTDLSTIKNLIDRKILVDEIVQYINQSIIQCNFTDPVNDPIALSTKALAICQMFDFLYPQYFKEISQNNSINREQALAKIEKTIDNHPFFSEVIHRVLYQTTDTRKEIVHEKIKQAIDDTWMD